MNRAQLAVISQQLDDMKKNPRRYISALSCGYVVAGFGGDLNGIHVPETILKGHLPPGTTPEQAFNQVVTFMEQVIEQAENKQKESPVSKEIEIGDGQVFLEKK